jgi:hypothetical protein
MKFGRQLSVSAFKAMHNATTMQVVKNPTNDKLFVTADGVTVGAVSKNYDATQPKEFVELLLEDTGETLWCLHNPSTVNVLETF